MKFSEIADRIMTDPTALIATDGSNRYSYEEWSTRFSLTQLQWMKWRFSGISGVVHSSANEDGVEVIEIQVPMSGRYSFQIEKDEDD